MDTSSTYDVIVIGGGAAGLMASATAAKRGKRVLLIEKNKKLGEKLSITGGGRCNITNAEEYEKVLLAHYGSAAPFLFSAFSQFGVKSTFAFFEGLGVPIVVEARKRAFPASQKASDVTKALVTFAKDGGVEVLTGTPIARINRGENGIESVTAGKKEYRATSYILATGGVSHQETGSTGDGFKWLKELGHKVARPTPTIVPLKTKETWSKQLAGIAIPAMKMTFFVNEKRAFSLMGDVLLTHFGVSGPTILNAAGRVADLLHEGEVTARIDTQPGMDLGILDRHIASVFDANKNKALKNVFKELAPKGTGDVLLSLDPQIDPEKKVHSVTREERRKLAELLKNLPLTFQGLMGLDRAVVADGGVPLTELDMRTMRSLVCQNLYVVGDLLHINRPTGGYSLQLCWTTGYVAGQNA